MLLLQRHRDACGRSRVPQEGVQFLTTKRLLRLSASITMVHTLSPGGMIQDHYSSWVGHDSKERGWTFEKWRFYAPVPLQ